MFFKATAVDFKGLAGVKNIANFVNLHPAQIFFEIGSFDFLLFAFGEVNALVVKKFNGGAIGAIGINAHMHTAHHSQGGHNTPSHGNRRGLQVLDIDSHGHQAGNERSRHHPRDAALVARNGHLCARLQGGTIGGSQFDGKFWRDVNVG